MKITTLEYKGIVLAKKNRHIIGRNGVVMPDAKARANEQDIINQIAAQLDWRDTLKDQTERMLDARKNGYEYAIEFEIWAGNDIRRDLDNQASTLLDALVKAGALPDDSTKFLKSIMIKHCGLDRIDPRAIIRIYRTERGE